MVAIKIDNTKGLVVDNQTGGNGGVLFQFSGSISHGSGSYSTGSYSHAEGFQAFAGAPAYLSKDAGYTTPGTIILDSIYGDLTGTFFAESYITLSDLAYDNTFQHGVFQISTSIFNSPNTELVLVDNTVSTSTASVGVQGIVDTQLLIGADQTIGYYSHAEGNNTVADGLYSHAEGEYSVASGIACHAEGNSNRSLGRASHSEGYGTLTLGEGSHSEGYQTIAKGIYSHAEGRETIASGTYQHVGGVYNLRNNDFSLFVIGNGIGNLEGERSDIFRVNTDSVQVSGSLIVSGAYIHNVVSGTTAPTYDVGSWDHVVVFTSNVVTATLPTSAPIGRKIIFKDGTGAASTAGGQMISCSLGIIDGSATYTMASVNYTAISVIKINEPDEWIVV